jgi:hypothetical protein
MAKFLAIVSLMCMLLCIVGCARQPKVTLILDKDTYIYGESVKTQVSFDKAIYIKSPWNIQRWEDGDWITLPQRTDFVCNNIIECSGINWTDTIDCHYTTCDPAAWTPISESIAFSWDQKEQVDKLIYECVKGTNKITNQTCVVFGQADAGRYQIVFSYATRINKKKMADDSGIHIYNITKEFRIKGNLLNATSNPVNTPETGLSFEYIRDRLKKANVHISGEGQESTLDLLSLARTTQEILNTVCADAGYNISGYITSKVSSITYPISETYKNASLTAVVLLNENQIVCIYKKVAEDSHIKPGIFSLMNPKFCESANDCVIKYNVRYNEECSAGCFNTAASSDNHCTLVWEMFTPDATCSCFQQQCIMNK